ncbi:MAG: CRISPR-associated endonuclease Cas2 [Clostridia bacterium]|nr:CRISPR-associated endonuclease Cas2 [Clostridia bacterium]
MRILVFFDLPVETAADRRNYTRFRKFLIKSGYMMLQKSVYCKLALNMTAANASIESVRRNKPPDGFVSLLVITEKQYSRMEMIVGEFQSDVVSSDERLVVL